MKLPLALQTAIDESERMFEQTLQRLGLSRRELVRLAERIRANSPPMRPAAASRERSVYHV